jgi:uncharacterized protein with GYD domain
MATYFMFGNYSQDSVQKISANRTSESIALIEKNGGKLSAGYALLGDIDLILIVEFPSNEDAMKTSVGLSQLLGIAFTTAPAVNFEDFDKLVG